MTVLPSETIPRVLVVDDSVVVRQIVSRVVNAEPTLELAGVAANGRIALAKIERLRPDVVVLDLEMPGMDGYETLAAIREIDKTLPVIIFSHLSSAGAAATLDALALGATDFALKPRADGIGLAEQTIRDELVPLITAFASRPVAGSDATEPVVGRTPGSVLVSAIVVAVSTGGPNALAKIVPSLPADLPVPVLIVQHMPPVFTRSLAQRLDRRAAVVVVEAADDDAVVAGRVYIAPGGRHLELIGTGADVRVHLTDGPPESSCRPAADVLFRSAVAAYGSGTLAAVLTGMGRDGLRGAQAVRMAGGVVLAQSEASAVITSMPAAVAAAGLADAIVPLEEIAAELVRWTEGGR